MPLKILLIIPLEPTLLMRSLRPPKSPSMIPPFIFSSSDTTSNWGQVYLAARRTPRVFFDASFVRTKFMSGLAK